MQNRGVTKREVSLAAAAVGAGVIAVYVVAMPARQEKMSRSCDSNLHQLGLAMQMYGQDFDDTLPRPWFGRDAGPSDARANYKWMDVLFPYAKSERLFTCPADSQSKPYHFRQSDSYGSYLFNDAYFAPGDKLTPPGGRQTTSIYSNRTVLVMCGGSGGFRFTWPDSKSQPPLEEDHVGALLLRHVLQGCAPSPTVLHVDGIVNGAGFRRTPAQVMEAKPINGRIIYTSLTIEDD